MIAKDSLSTNARGGTELMKGRLIQSVNPTLLDKFQIFFSRVEEDLDPTKIRILYCHDLPNDPASGVLANEGWKKFHMLIFVSHWQMQNYIAAYNIPWSKCAVIRNAIEPFERHDKPQDGTIRLAYWSTPHRGLELLIPAFEAISQRRPNVVLDVYSSFNLYGWPQRDEQYKPLFEKCKAHPKINYHGSVSNETLREALKDTHIFAYPSIWPETSCLCLIEAMSARLVCVHSSLAALPETSLSQTYMYQFNENPDNHASDFASFLDLIIGNYWSEQVQVQITNLKVVADNTYNLERFSNAWNALLTELASRVESGQMRTEIEGAYFTYKT